MEAPRAPPTGHQLRIMPGCRSRPRSNRALLVPVLADLTSLLTTSRQTGVHLPNLQPSTGQFFASLDPINEASAILGPLNTNPRSSVQHQFQDTFPGTSRPSSTLPWRRALRPGAAPFLSEGLARKFYKAGVCIGRFRFWAKAGLRGGEEELGPDLEDRPIECRSNNLGRERSGEGGEEETRVPDSFTRARGSTS